LSYLKRLPIDEVKIDKSFVLNMDEDDNSLAIVEGIISLCKKMNFDVVAEGVEEKIHSTLLRALRCDICQGYFYSRPVPAEDAVFEIL
jgi:EAL domain-containing protein (putative c-di-GMP-specific phosphodiesterase class I)